MGFFNKLINSFINSSLPIYKFENNKLNFKITSNDYYNYSLGNYEEEIRHDYLVSKAYTIKTNDIFLEYIEVNNNTIWNGQALSLYEGFFKEKLKINEITTLEKKDIQNYTFKVYNIDDSFILHMIYIYTVNSDLMIIDTKGDLYKELFKKLDSKYIYKYDEKEKVEINFNISMVKENFVRGFFGSDND